MLETTITHSTENHIKPNRFGLEKISVDGFATANNTTIIIDLSMILCELLQTHFVGCFSFGTGTRHKRNAICPLFNRCDVPLKWLDGGNMNCQGIVRWQNACRFGPFIIALNKNTWFNVKNTSIPGVICVRVRGGVGTSGCLFSVHFQFSAAHSFTSISN